MRSPLFLPLLVGLLLPSIFLSGQSFDFALTGRYNDALSVNGLEPSENGPRDYSSQIFFLEFEFRTSARIGWLINLGFGRIQSAKNGETSADIPGPFNVIHPYSSELQTAYVQVGAQYNFRLLEGDLSIGLLAGPGAAEYQRDWNVLNLLLAEGDIIGRDQALTTFTDRSATTTRLRAAARLQYTYWFAPSLAFSAGVEYSHSFYLGGGIETIRGERYEIEDQRFLPEGFPSGRTPLIYDLNYDRTTQVPDPSVSIKQFQFTLGITSRI